MPSTVSILEDRAHGCMMGQLVGDALGTTLEFKRGAAARALYPDGLRDIVGGGPFDLRAGQITDDSELALALARSLAIHGADLDSIARAYVEWYWSGPFDIGGQTRNAFGFYPGHAIDAHTVEARAASRNGDPSKQANGALMRVSPLAIYGAALPPERLAALARADARLSHPAPACQEANVAFVRAIAVGLQGADREAAYQAALASVDTDAGRATGVHGWLVEAAERNGDFDNWGMGWVRLALTNAFHQLLHARSFEEALVDTVMAGGDTDTNAAIAGALLGAVMGEAAIPAAWRETVLACRSPRPATYHTNDARALTLALLARGAADAGAPA